VSPEGLARPSWRREATGENELPRPVAALLANGELARLVLASLLSAGFTVECLNDVSSPALHNGDRRPVVFLLEYGMKQPDTVAFCRAVRTDPAYSQAAILFLARNTSEADRVAGLEAGADAYLAMPFAARELIAHINAVVRSYARRNERESLAVGEIEVNVAGMSATVAGNAVPLSISEFRLLEFFCRNVGRAVSRDKLLQIISKNARVGRRAVDVYIRRLRKKIEPNPAQPSYLKTVRGIGYRLDGG
jgi:DNA-binding response OmpR family regulator